MTARRLGGVIPGTGDGIGGSGDRRGPDLHRRPARLRPRRHRRRPGRRHRRGVEPGPHRRAGGRRSPTSRASTRSQNLPVGEYTLRFELPGFTTVRRESLRVEVGRTIQVDIGMEVGTLEQAVTVTGEAPVVDAANAGFSTNFTQALLQNIPTARQSYFDVVTFAPAVRINQVPNDSRFIIFGSSSDQNQFQYDGVDISAVSNGGVWDFPSPDIMQEVQVKAIGASAEFHSFQGGVVNIVTKSGSNDFRGMLSAYVIPGDWVANNTPNEQFPYTVHYNQQGTIELGGRDQARPPVVLRHPPGQPRGHDRRRRRPEPRARRRRVLQAVPQGHRALLPERQPVGGLEQQHVLLRRHRQPHGAAQHPDRGARPQPGRLQPVHPDARQRHPARGPRRRHLHPRQLHALLERLRDARPHRPGHRRQLGERAERQQAVPQPHHHRRVDRPFHLRVRARLPRLQDRRPDRVMPTSAPSRPESAASATPISMAPRTARPTTTRRPPAAASGPGARTSRTPGR